MTVAAAAASAAVGARVLSLITTASPLRARNHRGLELPLGSGIAVLTGSLIGWGLLGLLGDLTGARRASGLVSWFALVGLGFGLLGLLDDLAGTPGERGWRAHAGALRRLRPTPGSIKLAGGAALALVAALPSDDGAGWGIVRAAVIALCANLGNLMDLRPGRASKVFLVAAAGLATLSASVAAPLAVVAAAVVACVGSDLRERVMLGDVGAYALGAIAGAAAVIHASHLALIVTLVALALVHAVADRPGLSAIIDAVPPLRAADRAGRVT